MNKRKIRKAIKILEKYFKNNSGNPDIDMFEAMMFIRILDNITDEYVQRVIVPAHEKSNRKIKENDSPDKILYPIIPGEA